MTPETVRRIYGQQLDANNPTDALMKACRKIDGTIFFNSIVTDDPLVWDEETWQIALRAIDSKARLTYFTNLPLTSISIRDTQLFNNLEILFASWRDSVKYVRDRYDQQSDVFKEMYSLDNLDDILKWIAENAEERALEVRMTDKVTVDPKYFLNFFSSANTTLNCILGSEIFEKYRDELVDALAWLFQSHREATMIVNNSRN